MAKARIGQKILNAVTATGPSAAVDTSRCTYATFTIEASSVTTGCTMKVESLSPSGQWCVVSTITVNANGNTVATVTGAHDQLRMNITARTDGTYTVGILATD